MSEATKKRTRGGQSSYTPELAEEILRRVSNGEVVRKICQGEHMPDERTVRRWISDNVNGFAPLYARAAEYRAEHIAEEILAIADDGENDTYVDENGERRTDNDVIQRSRLRVDARKWLLSKMLPKRYGDSSKLEVTGADGAPLRTEIVFVDPPAED